MSRKKFMKPVKVPFEGRMMNAPSNYDHYLTGLYHDYMQLPPVEKRVMHGMDAWLLEPGETPGDIVRCRMIQCFIQKPDAGAAGGWNKYVP